MCHLPCSKVRTDKRQPVHLLSILSLDTYIYTFVESFCLMHQSIPPAPSPTSGYCWEFAHLVSPGGGAFGCRWNWLMHKRKLTTSTLMVTRCSPVKYTSAWFKLILQPKYMVTLPKDSLFVCVSRLVHWTVVCEQAVGGKSVCKESGGASGFCYQA